MRAMQQLVKLPEISRTMQDLSKEMMKAGIIDEMLEETLDVMEPEEFEEETDKEIDKVRHLSNLYGLSIFSFLFIHTVIEITFV